METNALPLRQTANQCVTERHKPRVQCEKNNKFSPFLPRDAYAVTRCPSVCPCVRHSGGASYGAKGLKPPPPSDFAEAPQIFV